LGLLVAKIYTVGAFENLIVRKVGKKEKSG
jgi:hypothetical protein